MSIFSPVQAQTLDGLVSPTIQFDPPGGTVTPSPSQIVGPKIFLQSDKTNIAVGEKAKIQIMIDTAGTQIKSFSLQINFPADKVKVIDAVPTTTTLVEVNYLDTFFITSTNIVDNQEGIITLVAAANQNNTTTITNRAVAEFEVQGLTSGFINITVNQTNSSLKDANDVNALQGVQGVSLTIGQSGQPSVTPSVSIIPKSGIEDIFGSNTSILIGSLLILSGIYFLRLRTRAKIRR